MALPLEAGGSVCRDGVAPGPTLGAYQVTGLLGAGGMGEVYSTVRAMGRVRHIPMRGSDRSVFRSH